ncbi:hypothetical protein BH23GEM9_BH23GEM9_27190 [soil metagenome]
MNGGKVVSVCILCGALASPVWSQSAPVRVNLGGRMHYQWSSTSVDAAETASGASVSSTTFEHRRVRLSADVQLSDWIHGRVEPEFAMGRLQLRNAWIAFELDSAVVLRAGQFKKPFGLVQLTSSSTLAVIERGVRIRGLENALRHADEEPLVDLRGELMTGEHFTLQDVQRYSAYDMGVAVEGRHGAVGWSAGVFNGQGPDTRNEDAGVSAAARLSWSIAAAAPFTVSGAWSRRALNWPTPLSTEGRSGNAFAVDVELGGFRRGVWLLAEAMTGDNLATEERFAGAHAILSYFAATGQRRVEGIEPVGRISYGDPDRTIDGDEGLLLTPGLNLYFVGRNRLMLNWDVYVPQGAAFTTHHAARAQVNLHF